MNAIHAVGYILDRTEHAMPLSVLASYAGRVAGREGAQQVNDRFAPFGIRYPRSCGGYPSLTAGDKKRLDKLAMLPRLGLDFGPDGSDVPR